MRRTATRLGLDAQNAAQDPAAAEKLNALLAPAVDNVAAGLPSAAATTVRENVAKFAKTPVLVAMLEQEAAMLLAYRSTLPQVAKLFAVQFPQ
jgi:hypothetical protein